MTRSKKILASAAALAALALAAGGGSAFTAGNSGVATATLGYSSTTVSGVTIATATYVLAADNSLLDKILYTVATDVSAQSFQFKINGGSWAACTDAYTSVTTITCDPTDLAVSTVTAVELVVN